MTTNKTPEAPIFNPTTGELEKLAATYASGSQLARRAVAVHGIRTRAEEAGERIIWDELALAVAGAAVAKLYSTTAGAVIDMVDTKAVSVSADTLKQAGYAAEWLSNLGVSLSQNMPLLGRVVSAWATIPAAARKDFAAVVEAAAPAELAGVAVPAATLSERRAAVVNEGLAEVLALANADKAAKRAARKAAQIEAAAEAAAAEAAAERATGETIVAIDGDLSAFDAVMVAIALIRDNLPTLDEDDAITAHAALSALVGELIPA